MVVDDPFRSKEVWASPGMILMCVNHHPTEIGWTNEEFNAAEITESYKRAGTFIRTCGFTSRSHGQPIERGRKRYYQVTIANLISELVFRFRTPPHARSTSERVGVELAKSTFHFAPSGFC